MKKMRRLAQFLIYLDFWSNIAWYMGLAVVGIVSAVVAWMAGKDSEVVQYLAYSVVGIATLTLVWWIVQDARAQVKRLRQEGRVPPSPKDGDMSEAAGLPPRPPWMG